jgi:chromate reductase, NAD(P)H dehydrogenase (quinone)
MKVLAVCGSLRAASINRALLRTAARLAPAGTRVALFDGMADVPLFNFDLDSRPPAAVERWRLAVSDADALLIASPEYAHGVSGVMKNALDWLVSLEAFYFKPVAVLNAQPRSRHADQALRETLRTMSASLIEAASIDIELSSASLTEEGMMAAPGVTTALSTVWQQLRLGWQVRTGGAHDGKGPDHGPMA